MVSKLARNSPLLLVVGMTASSVAADPPKVIKRPEAAAPDIIGARGDAEVRHVSRALRRRQDEGPSYTIPID